MLSPADLLELAEEFSARIPPGPEYLEDRNSAWLAIGEAWLKLNDGASAMRALSHLDHPRCDAVLRHAIAMWTSEHPLLEPGCDLLRELAARIGEWEPSFSRRELSDLVLPLYRIGGEPLVREYASQLKDPFSVTVVLTTFSYFVRDAESRHAVLQSAECSAQHDYALLHVFNGYRAAGFEADAERIRIRMSVPPELSDKPILAAENTLAAAEALLAQHVPEALPDEPLARLRRFEKYGFNDLKVQFLADIAISGGIADPEIERLLQGEAFSTIEPPRAPSIYRDPSKLEVHAFARFLFARPARLDERDRELLDGSDCFNVEPVGAARLVRVSTRLFESFGEIAPSYSMEQIDQGLWLLLSGWLCLHESFWSPEVTADERRSCVESMYFPFCDYLALRDDYSGTAFFMWWDIFNGGEYALAVLEKILALPSAKCHSAALHGLNEMHPDPQAAAIVTRYIEENRHWLEPDDVEFAEECRDGRAL